MENSRKRQRVDSEAVTVNSFEKPSLSRLREYIDEIDEEDDGVTLKQLFLSCAEHNDAVARHIELHHQSMMLKRQTADLHREKAEFEMEKSMKIQDFDHNSKDVWYTLNKKYRSLSGSKAYDIAGEVFYEICDIIREIGEEASVEYAPFETAQSGLETLRKIGKTICLSSNNTLGHEVKKQFGQSETCLENSMSTIIANLSQTERDRMCGIDDGRSTFLEKLEELQDLSRGHYVFDNLGDVLDLISGRKTYLSDGSEHENGVDEEEEEEYDSEADLTNPQFL